MHNIINESSHAKAERFTDKTSQNQAIKDP